MSDGTNGGGVTAAPLAKVDPQTGEIQESEAERVLIMIAQLAAAIDNTADIAEAIALEDKSQAIEFLSRKIDLDTDVKNRATINVINARRRIGELTLEMPKQPYADNFAPKFQPETLGKLEAVAEHGLDKNEVYRNETLAKLPKDRLDEFIDEKLAAGYEITVGGALEYARNVLGQSGNGKHKPKTNRAGDPSAPQSYDACQTPPYAVPPVLEYLKPSWTVWEPAAGEGLLARALLDADRAVVSTDLLTGYNFFECEPPPAWDCIVTNPPYSIKYDWLARCYELGKPFALLMPVETLGTKTAQEMLKRYGMEVIFLDQRVDFKMPDKGWDSHAQFPVAWFCYGLLDRQAVFASIEKDKRAFLESLEKERAANANSH